MYNKRTRVTKQGVELLNSIHMEAPVKLGCAYTVHYSYMGSSFAFSIRFSSHWTCCCTTAVGLCHAPTQDLVHHNAHHADHVSATFARQAKQPVTHLHPRVITDITSTPVQKHTRGILYVPAKYIDCTHRLMSRKNCKTQQ